MKRFLSTSSSRFPIPSISFSGAGFLGVYHAGVYSCLLKHNHVLQPLEKLSPHHSKISPILTGVSAGALVSASISAGVTPENMMNVILKVAQRTKEKGGFMDVLRPGFSLIDQLEDLVEIEMYQALGGSHPKDSPNDYDNDLLMNRIQNGKLLHIGLTDREKFDFTNPKTDLKAYVYADSYRDIKDICSAAMLSSYIPFGTGPTLWEWDNKNLAVKRAWEIVKDMEQRGFLKHGVSGETVVGPRGILQSIQSGTEADDKEDVADDKLRYLDGGLANLCPEIDERTLIVAPINGIYSKPFIAPLAPIIDEGSILEKLNIIKHVEISDRVQIGANAENLLALYQMAKSSSNQVLEDRFRDGYDDAKRFLSEHDLLTVYSA